MSKILAIITGIVLLIGAYLYLNPAIAPVIDEIEQPQTSQQEFPFEFTNDNSITIIKFNADLNIQLLENHSAEITTEVFATNANCVGMINAGYFLPDYSHAGLLKLGGEIRANLARLDKQLTHIVTLNPLSFNDDAASFDILNNQSNSLFQTGPLIIQSNTIQNELINNSLNGKGEHLRSILGYTDENEIFFVISKLPITLTNLSERILASEMFSGKNISAINLDGGGSVSLFTQDRKAQYGIAKKLPYYLCVTD